MSTITAIESGVPGRQPRAVYGIIGVSIALSAPLVQILLRPFFESLFDNHTARFVSLFVFWIAVALVLAISVFLEGIPLALFGLKRWDKSLRAKLIELILAVIAAFVVGVVLFGVSMLVRTEMTGTARPEFDPANILPFWMMAFAWVTAAFTEEFLFRSYAIERLTMLTGKRWLAAAIAMLAFGLLHALAWDWIHVLTVVLPGGLLLTLIYLWRRSLLFVVVIHAILNIQLLFLPLIAPYL